MLLSTRRIVRAVCVLSASFYLLHYIFRAAKRHSNIEEATKGSALNGTHSFLGLMNESDAFPIYVINAYAINDNKIRITLITKCKYSPSLTVYIGQHYSASIEYEYLDNCPPNWRPKCNYGGCYANAVFPKEAIEKVLRGKLSIFMGYTAKQSNLKQIQLIDSRVDSSRPRPHRLAVCVSPIMQLAAWVLLPRFFEMWILHGATKFYAVVQSMTPEFDAMLRIYENDPTIDVERIPWGMLPTEEDFASENNPNNQITGAEFDWTDIVSVSEAISASTSEIVHTMLLPILGSDLNSFKLYLTSGSKWLTLLRLHSNNHCIERVYTRSWVQTLSMNDCLLRSRNSAEYVATVDYDEILVARSNSTLLELLDSFNNNDSDISAFVFRSSFVFCDDQTPFIRHPSDLSFDSLRNISLESEIYPAGSMSKLIVQPERTRSVNVHMSRDMEDEKYKTLIVDPAVAQLFHLRLVENILALRNKTSRNYELDKYIPGWTKQYNERIVAETRRIKKEKIKGNRITIAHKEWPNRSYEVAQEMEKCFMEYYLTDETCTAHTKCFPNITSVRMDEWILSEETTIVL